MSEPSDEYKLYETAPAIDKKWQDQSLIGECAKCGMDDAPIVIRREKGGWPQPNKCKWCAELDNLNYHLEHSHISQRREFRFDPIRILLYSGSAIGFFLFLTGFFLGWENSSMGALVMALMGGALYGYSEPREEDDPDDA